MRTAKTKPKNARHEKKVEEPTHDLAMAVMFDANGLVKATGQDAFQPGAVDSNGDTPPRPTSTVNPFTRKRQIATESITPTVEQQNGGTQEVQFELRGATGVEAVEITSDGISTVHVLPTGETTYTLPFPFSGSYNLHFLNEKESERIVHFAPLHPFTNRIQLLERNDEWRCGQSGESSQCSKIRGGEFHWAGVYQITPIKQVEFEIRGASGGERVKITTDGTATEHLLSKFQQTFTFPFPYSGSYTIHYLNGQVDGGSDNIVYFTPIHPASNEIQLGNRKEWNCGQEGEVDRCSEVRRGSFKWGGAYQVTPFKAYTCHSQTVGLDATYDLSRPFDLLMTVNTDVSQKGTGGIFEGRSGNARIELLWDSGGYVVQMCERGSREDCDMKGITASANEGQSYAIRISWDGSIAKWFLDGQEIESIPAPTGFGSGTPTLCNTGSGMSGGWKGTVQRLSFQPKTKARTPGSSTTPLIVN